MTEGEGLRVTNSGYGLRDFGFLILNFGLRGASRKRFTDYPALPAAHSLHSELRTCNPISPCAVVISGGSCRG